MKEGVLKGCLKMTGWGEDKLEVDQGVSRKVVNQKED